MIGWIGIGGTCVSISDQVAGLKLAALMSAPCS